MAARRSAAGKLGGRNNKSRRPVLFGKGTRKKPSGPVAAPTGGQASTTPKTLLQLTPRCCRWPIGDPGKPGFHFCGQPKLTGRPYCQTHLDRAFV